MRSTKYWPSLRRAIQTGMEFAIPLTAMDFELVEARVWNGPWAHDRLAPVFHV